MKIGVNNDLCSGCRVCQTVCGFRNFHENNPKKASIRIKAHFPVPGKFEIQFCDQCGNCFDVCPTGAIKKENGYYRIEPEECGGCLLCVETCPRGVIFTHADHAAPFKCTLCGDCLRYCPTNALYDLDGEVARR